ncbi:hypothetical protein FBALC1_02522 [Flavobacteriales bacterium ALC-1]|nr:hypothetical protein FBALC1_02522 [Flavobacteriales bacterium ALC-1]
MKIVLIFILTFFATSCCGTKKAIETQPEPTKEIAVVTEVPDAVEAPKIIKNKDSLVTISKGEFQIAVKTDSTETIEIEEDSTFHQNVSKREGYIHQLFGELLQKHVTQNGNVDYKGFKSSQKDLLGYISVLKKMYLKLDSLSKNEKLAYWINTYNALTIDLIIRNYPLKSIKEIKDPWDQRLWKFGDKWQNLNDIEHKILRKMNEPRIHFAIVCASESCPKLLNEAFTSENLEEQLSRVTKGFLSDTSKNELSKNNIKLSKIFKWFKKDFEKNGSLIDFLNGYSEVVISNKAKKSFKDYNWDLNN